MTKRRTTTPVEPWRKRSAAAFPHRPARDNVDTRIADFLRHMPPSVPLSRTRLAAIETRLVERRRTGRSSIAARALLAAALVLGSTGVVFAHREVASAARAVSESIGNIFGLSTLKPERRGQRRHEMSSPSTTGHLSNLPVATPPTPEARDLPTPTETPAPKSMPLRVPSAIARREHSGSGGRPWIFDGKPGVLRRSPEAPPAEAPAPNLSAPDEGASVEGAPPPLVAAKAQPDRESIVPPPVRIEEKPVPVAEARAGAPALSPAEVIVAPPSESSLLATAIRKLRREGDAPEALATLDRYRATHPTGALAPEALLLRAEALFHLDRRDAALSLLEHADLEQGPRVYELRLARAELRAGHDCAAAMRDFDWLLHQPAVAEHAQRALRGRALCRERMRDLDGATADARLALHVSPGTGWATELLERLQRASAR